MVRFPMSWKRFRAFGLVKLELTTVGDLDWSRSTSRLGSNCFNLLDNIHTFNNTAENDMLKIQLESWIGDSKFPWIFRRPLCSDNRTYLSVEPFGFDGAKKELWTISVWSGIGHWENSWSSVLQLKVFIFEFVSVDWFTSGTIVVCEVTTLNVFVRESKQKNGSSKASWSHFREIFEFFCDKTMSRLW